MADTVSLPVVGKAPKKELVIGVVVVAGLAVVYYVRKKSGTAAGTAATSTDQYPSDGTTGNPSDPYSLDPASGVTYGNEAAGSGGTFGAFGGLGGSNSSGDSGSGSLGSTAASGPPFSSNSQWASYVLQTLEANNPSQDPGVLADAIGVYLAGQPVTPTQQTLVFDAIAVGGDPPTPGTNNFPPKVQVTGSNGPGTGPPPPPPPAKVAVPVTFGMRAEDAISKIEAAGLTVSTSPARNPRNTYVSTGSSPEGGTRVDKGSHVTLHVKIGV